MIEASVAIQVLPKTSSHSESELLRIVDAVIARIAESGYHYVVSPFETVIEGDLDGLLDLVKDCQYICIKEGANSVMAYVRIVYAPKEGVLTIEDKLKKY